MNLELIKPKAFTIKIGKTEYPIRFTLESFAYLEGIFGSVEKAVDAFNARTPQAITEFLIAGLKLDDESKIKKLKIDENLILTIAEVVQDALPTDYKFDENWDWSLLYYIVRPALNLSQEEFWNSTPKKLTAFIKILEKQKQQYEAIDNHDQAVQAFMSW